MKEAADNYSAWSLKNIFFFLLIVSIPFSFEYHFSATLGTDIPDEPLMAIVSFVFLAVWIYRPSLISIKVFQHPIILILLAIFSWTLVTILFSTHSLVSLKFLLAKSWYIGAFVLAGLVVFADKKNISITAALILLSMFLVVVIQGIPGLILLLCLFGFLIRYAEKNYQQSENEFDRVVALMIASILSMLLRLNFLSDLIETDKLGSIFYLCIALLIAIPKRKWY